ncbi:VOC family protein [Pedobacter antarcticus]|uniref:VOC family protein n=1 Tax=Pedobacter antarcticus TaxID=34086 RepID=UPI001C5607D2|nr:VOC family protein [Pedobacter antarcticus]
MMANPTQLSFVSLQVSDLEVSGKFYTEILNFKPILKSPPDAIVFEQKNGASFAIRKPMIELSKANLLGWGVAVWFGVGDLDVFLEENGEKITIVKDIHKTPFGRILVISDPDGYSITLQETKQD